MPRIGKIVHFVPADRLLQIIENKVSFLGHLNAGNCPARVRNRMRTGAARALNSKLERFKQRILGRGKCPILGHGMPDMDEQHKSVLCVDDDPDSLKMRQVLLEANGFDVITASSASEGLSLFRSRPVNAVILDYQMPWMNGGELARLMKGLNPAIPVMILSALPRLPEDAPRCIDAFISKCAPSAQIMAKIASLVA